MKVRKITVEFSRTVSPVEYWPVRIGRTMEADLEDGDNAKECRMKLHRILKKEVDELCEEEMNEPKVQRMKKGQIKK